jgi:ribonucleotide reductase alpha subunit
VQEATNYFNGDELSASVWTNKYALRDSEGNLLEKTPADTHRRLAKEFARIEAKYPNPMSEEEIYSLLADWTIVPQGSPMSAIGNPYQIQSSSNCFVLENVIDSYGGILHSDQQLVQIMKRRGGVGLDISGIRPRDMKTSNAAGTTDGLGIFMERYSNSTREVAQGGRRGALMISCHVLHPEILTFIQIKQDKSKVTGANISVRITDDFMRAVESDSEVTLRWPVTATVEEAKVTKIVKAREIWNLLVESNWNSAEPGILFWDRILSEGMADIYPEFRSVSTNPCVTGETLVLTRQGNLPINTLIGKPIDVWNGMEWSTVTPYSTGPQDTCTVTLSDGDYLDCTLNHGFLVKAEDNSIQKITAENLTQGMALCNYILPRGHEVPFDRRVQSIEHAGIRETFCFTEPKLGQGTFNGIVTSNCGEIPLSAYDSCRLLLLNLTKFVACPFKQTAWSGFSVDPEKSFKSVVGKAQRLMDDLVDLEIEAVDRILAKIDSDPEPETVKTVERDLWTNIRKAAVAGRRTGLGVTGLGDALAMCNIKYGSVESVKATEQIYEQLALAAHESSIQLAVERGAFPVCDPFLYDSSHPFVSRLDNSGEGCEHYTDLFHKIGRRNIALTTTAPAGSMSILTQTSSGCEPVFMLSYTRRKKVNPNDTTARVDFVDQSGDKWQEYTVHHHGLKQWMEVTGETDITKSPYYGATANEIDWEKSVEIQAAAQKWIEHSISKTCNLPSTVTKEQVSDLYFKAWRSGCKGFTIYRDGCRSGVLVASSEKDKKPEGTPGAPKRPASLACDIHRTIIAGEPYIMVVGLLDGKPYEIFSGLSKHLSLPKSKISGRINKRPKKEGLAFYDLHVPVGDEELVFENIVEMFDSPNYGAFTRTISLSLRHGVPVQFVVEQLRKDKHSDMTSFAAAVARVLSKHYIPDGTKATGEKACPECKSTDLSYQGGCSSCLQCGWSKCS